MSEVRPEEPIEDKIKRLFIELELKNVDFDSLLVNLGYSATDLERQIQTRKAFRMPRIIFPAILVSQAGGVATVRALASANPALDVNAINLAFDGSAYVVAQTGSVKGVPASGASPITVFAAAGAGLKRRVFDIVIGSSASGVVVLSDGLGSIQVLAASATAVHYGPNGVLQDTADTAITATLAAATLSAIGAGNAGE